jgi:hypothetical protein
VIRFMLGLLIQWAGSHDDPHVRRSAGVASFLTGLLNGGSRSNAAPPAPKHDWFRHHE